ncbi:tetratricopeptide repeat protein [Micromonospora sp. M12]
MVPALDDDPYGWFDLHQELLLAVVRVPAGANETLPVGCAGGGSGWPWRCAGGWRTPSGSTSGSRSAVPCWPPRPPTTARRSPAGRTTSWACCADAGTTHRGGGRAHPRGQRTRAPGTAQARMNLGLALLDLGQLDDAVEHLEMSRRHRSGADRAGHALTDLGLGAAQLARVNWTPRTTTWCGRRTRSGRWVTPAGTRRR